MIPPFDSVDDWLAWQERLDPREIRLGLERVSTVLARLPPPPRHALVLLVGGTNGKGSCVAYLSAMLTAAGRRVGAYTSPHLLRYHERIRIGDADIDDDALLRAFNAVEAVRDGVPLTYFEYGTLAAVAAFAAAGCDAWVMEVGLGGRLDAVNALQPDGSLVVSVALDHQDWLGRDRDAIGREKAGIYRAGRPAVCADPDPPAGLLERCRAGGIELRCAGRDYRFEVGDRHWRYRSPALDLPDLPLPSLPGRVQPGNAAAAVALLEAVLGPGAIPPLTGALAGVHVPGRFQRHARDGVEWVLDVAHNPAAAAALADTLHGAPPAGRTLAVFGCLDTKDHAGVLAQLRPAVDEWLVAPADGAGAVSPDALRVALAGAPVETCADIPAACGAAMQRARPGDRVLVAGSFHVVGPALAWLGLSSEPG